MDPDRRVPHAFEYPRHRTPPRQRSGGDAVKKEALRKAGIGITTSRGAHNRVGVEEISGEVGAKSFHYISNSLF